MFRRVVRRSNLQRDAQGAQSTNNNLQYLTLSSNIKISEISHHNNTDANLMSRTGNNNKIFLQEASCTVTIVSPMVSYWKN